MPKTTKNKVKMSTFEMCAKRFIDQIMEANLPWENEWVGTGGAYNVATGAPYGLLNQMVLDKPGAWGTLHHWSTVNGRIRAGEHGKEIYYWTRSGKGFRLAYSKVFHSSQIDLAKFEPREQENHKLDDVYTIVLNYTDREGIICEEPEDDVIRYEPDFKTLFSPDLLSNDANLGVKAYEKLFNELIRSTKEILRPDLKDDKEQLTCLFGSAALMNMFGLKSNKSYSVKELMSYISAISNSPRLVVDAASNAEKAINYILTGKFPTYTKNVDDDDQDEPELTRKEVFDQLSEEIGKVIAESMTPAFDSKAEPQPEPEVVAVEEKPKKRTRKSTKAKSTAKPKAQQAASVA